MSEKQKKIIKFQVGKTASRKMRTASLDIISGLYERFCSYKQTEGGRENVKRLSVPFSLFK